jgi:hypothetical protein
MLQYSMAACEGVHKQNENFPSGGTFPELLHVSSVRLLPFNPTSTKPEEISTLCGCLGCMYQKF